MERSFLLQRVQPGLNGLMDGSLSTLAPIFAVVLATHHPFTAFITGLATAIGAGVSMAFSEGLSDTGDLTGRGNPFVRGAITGVGTFVGGVFHTLPFLIADYHVAIVVAVIVVAVELVALAARRRRRLITSRDQGLEKRSRCRAASAIASGSCQSHEPPPTRGSRSPATSTR
jgi:hypothetical protein